MAKERTLELLGQTVISELLRRQTEAGVPLAAHLVGARGAGMKALGELLADRGWQLSGSDQTEPGDFETPSPFDVQIGHASDNVPHDLDLLIHSPAVRPENPERQIARERGIPELSYTEMLAHLMQERDGVCIAGTHGKTTTSAMTAFVLRESGLQPSAAVGGELVNYRRSGWTEAGRQLVVESCEYRRHFLDFTPQLAAILNVEADHFDCFPTLRAASEAYAAFAALIPAHGLLVLPEYRSGLGGHSAQQAAIYEEIAQQTAARIERFAMEASRSAAEISSGSTFSTCPTTLHQSLSTPGDHETTEWLATDLIADGPRTRFRIAHRGSSFGSVELQVPGCHNVLNALAATALAHAAGATADSICEALGRFRGVRRRFEIVGDWRGATVIDDYAHHPTAISATIAAARQYFGQRRLVCVFQPHQVSRTLGLLNEFATCFAGADDVLLAPIYAARESIETARAAQQSLAERAAAAGTPIRQMTSLDHLLTTLEHSTRPEDVLLIMGAGDINRIGYELTRSVSRDYAG